MAVMGEGDPVVDLRSVRFEYDRSLTVFAGVVTSVEDDRATFRVDTVWKGPITTHAVMWVGTRQIDGTLTRTSCDYHFKAGEKYVVYAFGASVESMRTHSCSRTRVAEYAAQEILNLDYVRSERARPAR